jgi:tetratricopeptide (TPR) repeat protein
MRYCGMSLLAVASMVAACAHNASSVVVPPQLTPAARVARAQALVREGCLDCLLDAFNEYDALRANAAAADAALNGAVETAALIALRERELGLLDESFMDRARTLAASATPLDVEYTPIFEMIETMPARWTVGQAAVSDDRGLAAIQKAYRNRDAWLALLRSRTGRDAISSYVWLAFNCAVPVNGINPGDVPNWISATGSWSDSPLLTFRAATCAGYDRGRLAQLVDSNPRFIEIDYFLAFTATRQGRLDEAAALLEKAYQWRPRWPSVTLQMAGVYLTAEEFDASHDFYQRTLTLAPGFVDALLGDLKALTYAGRRDEAIATADRLLALEHWYIGDARYWRALNEAQLARYDDAWADVELAAKLILNSDVPKLAGIIAYRRHELDVSRAKFEESRMRNPGDCEVGFYLQVVDAEQARWAPVADVAPASAVCFDGQEVELKNQIADIRTKALPPERIARQIAKREQTIANNARMRATCWFNAAVASFNLKNTDDARRYGEKVADDEQFGQRVKELLSRLREER